MNATRKDTRPARRIAVVLGGGDADMRALGILASVLTEISSEVAGLFLEDVNLFRVAELPFSHEISRLTSRAHPLSAIELERQVHVQAVRAERTVRLTAERAGLKWSFQRMRGRLRTALQAASDVDLLLLSATRRGVVSAGEVLALARALRASEGEAMQPIVVVFDGSEPATRALQTAIRLSSSTNRPLEVLLAAETPEVAGKIRAHVSDLLGPQPARFRRVSNAAIESLAEAIRACVPALLVIGADERFLEGVNVGLLRQNVGCPALIVR